MNKTLSQVVWDWFFGPVIARLNEMENNIMTQEADLQQAVADMKAAQLAANQAVLDGFKRLEDKIAALGTGPDLTQEIADVKAESDALKTMTTTAQAEGLPPVQS